VNGIAPRDVVDRIAAAVSGGSQLLVLCDFDGTLSHTVDSPHLAVIHARSRTALLQLTMRAGCHLGLVSGRSLEDLVCIADIPARFIAGSGGLELLCDGRRFVPPGWREAKLLMASVAADLQQLSADIPGVWVEPKACALTIHYRGAPLASVMQARRLAAGVIMKHPDHCTLIEGSLGIEINAFPDRDKGSAVKFFRRRVGNPRVCMCYCGNDSNDAPALAFVNACGGWSIGVGDSAPCEARCHVANPDALAEFLEKLAAAVKPASSV
jgi:trehalose-phosphatase